MRDQPRDSYGAIACVDEPTQDLVLERVEARHPPLILAGRVEDR